MANKIQILFIILLLLLDLEIFIWEVKQSELFCLDFICVLLCINFKLFLGGLAVLLLPWSLLTGGLYLLTPERWMVILLIGNDIDPLILPFSDLEIMLVPFISFQEFVISLAF